MKILYTITKSEAGGAQTHLSQLSEYMKNNGNEVAVMAFPGGFLEQEINEMGIKFFPNVYFKNSYNPLLGLKAIKEIKKAVKELNPDIISCHSSVAGLWTRLAVRNRIPTVFTAHGWAFTDGISFFKKIIAVSAEKIAGKFSSKIICVSENDRQLGLKYRIAPESKIITIHNGVELIEERENKNNLVEIIFIGRLSDQKDPETLVESFSELPEKIREKSIVKIIGGGDKMEKIKSFVSEKKIENKVLLMGDLKRQDVFKELKKSDIFVLTSFWEGFPRSILEAMSAGLPVIASNVGGVNEIVDDSVGNLIERKDKEKLKKALIELIENPEKRKEKGRNARKRIEDEFLLERMLEKTREVYESLGTTTSK